MVFAETRQFWFEEAQSSLKRNLERKENVGIAKNVVFFLGDGMSLATITAARIYKGQKNKNSGEEQFLSFEKFPYVSLAKVRKKNLSNFYQNRL